MRPPIETEPQEITVAGHRFLVWVRVLEDVADDDVTRAVAFEAGRRARGSYSWAPYDEEDGKLNVESSVLNGATVGVRYLGPVVDPARLPMNPDRLVGPLDS